MKIAYIRFGILPEQLGEQEFNFLPETKFRYSPESGELVIWDGPKLVEDFFPKGISSVTGVIGKNGSGKTTLLREISLERYAEYIDPVSQDIIVLENSKGELIIYGNHGFAESKVKDHRNIKSKIKVEILGGNLNWGQIPEISEKTTIIYYSNVFDSQDLLFDKSGTNISTAHLVRQDKRRNLMSFKHNQTEIQVHRHHEVVRKVLYLGNHAQFDLGFKPPELLFFKLNDQDSQEVLNNIGKISSRGDISKEEKLKLDTIASLVRQCLELVNEGITPGEKADWEDKRKFLFQLKRVGIFNIINNLFPSFFREQGPLEKYVVSCLESLKEVLTSDLEINMEQLISEIEEIERPLKAEFEKGVGKRASFLDSLERLNTCISSLPSEYSLGEFFDNTIFIPIKENLIHEITKFIWAYAQSFMTNDYGSFDFRGMSSGEDSFLTIFSRFSALINSPYDKTPLKENLIICLDEGDTYFHPEWQRKYFKLIVNFLSQLFDGKESIQLILSSHSPFLLSDLPTQCVIFMGKEFEKLGEPKDYPQTFAANIHLLFSQLFFMDSTIGAFADEKIQAVIDYLRNGSHDSIPDRKTAQKHISLIGEPLLRKELQRMLDSKRLSDLEERVDLLEKRNEDRGES